MNWPAFLTVFSSTFIAELGDKTQLSTLLFASDSRHSRWLVFTAASLALVTSSALGVLAGTYLGRWFTPSLLRYLAGFGFIAIGLYTLLKHE